MWLGNCALDTPGLAVQAIDDSLCSPPAERQEEEWDRKTVTRTIDEQDEATAAAIAEATKVGQQTVCVWLGHQHELHSQGRFRAAGRPASSLRTPVCMLSPLQPLFMGKAAPAFTSPLLHHIPQEKSKAPKEKSKAPSDLRTLEEVKQEQQKQGLQRLAAALQQNKALALGAVVILAAGGYMLYQQGAFAALASALESAAAAAARLWAVAANLVRWAGAGRGGQAVWWAGCHLRHGAARMAGVRSVTMPPTPPSQVTTPFPPSHFSCPCSKLPLPHIHDSEKGLLETIWLLLASVVMVPLICKIPGGSPVLGFLVGLGTVDSLHSRWLQRRVI